MTPERYSDLIRALSQAGVNAFGADPIVPYEELITREDALMLRTFRIRTE
jgi:hypothetical protein